MAIGIYESVWLFVAFDLPTLTPDDRRRANRFREDLKQMGFSKFQLSIYSYYFKSKQQALAIADKIGAKVPPNGEISTFFITDMHFSMIRSYYGGKSVHHDIPEQGLLFL